MVTNFESKVPSQQAASLHRAALYHNGQSKATEEYLERRSRERHVDNRIEIQLEEDGGGGKGQSWMETIISYHIISSYHIVDLKWQNRLKVGTNNLKLKVKMQLFKWFKATALCFTGSDKA